jgi:1-aminocyclopropane-1-carboxylate deaminase/D-cysteine desulfhydrase-like pyridoxal-dependent ACC family enzyme
MQVLLDEDVPIQVLEILRVVLKQHDFKHVQELGWKGKKDTFLITEAKEKGYDVLLTNNRKQLSNPDECAAIKRSGIHHVIYDQGSGLSGLGLAVAAIIATMPALLEELADESEQRLVRIHRLQTRRRFDVTDPRKNPPTYWPR